MPLALPESGEILLHREQGATRLHRMPVHKTARAGVARTYQNIRLFSRMSVLENLLVAQHAFVNRHLLPGIFETPDFRRCMIICLILSDYIVKCKIKTK